MECIICFMPYTVEGEHSPKILQCGHTFCLKCLQGILTSANPNSTLDNPASAPVIGDNDRIPCPICRVESTAQQVRHNYALQDAIKSGLFRGARSKAPSAGGGNSPGGRAGQGDSDMNNINNLNHSDAVDPDPNMNNRRARASIDAASGMGSGELVCPPAAP